MKKQIDEIGMNSYNIYRQSDRQHQNMDPQLLQLQMNGLMLRQNQNQILNQQYFNPIPMQPLYGHYQIGQQGLQNKDFQQALPVQYQGAQQFPLFNQNNFQINQIQSESNNNNGISPFFNQIQNFNSQINQAKFNSFGINQFYQSFQPINNIRNSQNSQQNIKQILLSQQSKNQASNNSLKGFQGLELSQNSYGSQSFQESQKSIFNAKKNVSQQIIYEEDDVQNSILENLKKHDDFSENLAHQPFASSISAQGQNNFINKQNKFLVKKHYSSINNIMKAQNIKNENSNNYFKDQIIEHQKNQNSQNDDLKR